MPPFTLYFLQASRSIRVAWLLAELDLPYDLRFFDRENERAPPTFKQSCGHPLGKAPTFYDGQLMITESGAISQYLCEKYDKEGRLTGVTNEAHKVKILQWVHAAEGTFMTHALPIVYTRWTAPPQALPSIERGLAANIHNDLNWLEGELAKSTSGWLVGDEITLADIMMHFSVDFIFARRLGVKEKPPAEWKKVNEWLEKCKNEESYRKAVETTGHTLFPETGVNWRAALE